MSCPPQKRRAVRSTRRWARQPGPVRGDMASAGHGDDGDDEDDVQQHQMPVFPSDDDEQDTQQSQVPVFDTQQSQVPVFDAQQSQLPVFTAQQQSGQLQQLPANNNQVDVFDKPAGGRRADLSRDTLVNTLLEQQHARAGLIMVDPDAELMDVRDGKVVGTYSPGRAQQAQAQAEAQPARQATRPARRSREVPAPVTQVAWTEARRERRQ